MMWRLCAAAVAFSGLLVAPCWAKVKEQEMSEGFLYVTCGSLIKLNSNNYNHRLHSHEVTYGSGSMQQSVTGMPDGDDINSYWLVKSTADKVCPRGAKIKCNSVIRLTHQTTNKNLHTHLHRAPLSGHQEVSAFGDRGEGDSGDYWRVICLKPGNTHWMRQTPVRFQSLDTQKYLATHTMYKYGQPIHGQLEVHAKGYADTDTEWRADEGLYIKESGEEY